MKKIRDQDLFERTKGDCKINNDGTCGNCGENLSLKKEFTKGPEIFMIMCSECGEVNTVSKIRLEEANK